MINTNTKTRPSTKRKNQPNQPTKNFNPIDDKYSHILSVFQMFLKTVWWIMSFVVIVFESRLIAHNVDTIYKMEGVIKTTNKGDWKFRKRLEGDKWWKWRWILWRGFLERAAMLPLGFRNWYVTISGISLAVKRLCFRRGHVRISSISIFRRSEQKAWQKIGMPASIVSILGIWHNIKFKITQNVNVNDDEDNGIEDRCVLLQLWHPWLFSGWSEEPLHSGVQPSKLFSDDFPKKTSSTSSFLDKHQAQENW